jgi:hypothetical protein
MALAVAREGCEADKASSTCMILLSTPSAEGTVSKSICPAALRGALRRPRWTMYMSKVDLAVWRRPARDVYEVLMTTWRLYSAETAETADTRKMSHTCRPSAPQ